MRTGNCVLRAPHQSPLYMYAPPSSISGSTPGVRLWTWSVHCHKSLVLCYNYNIVDIVNWLQLPTFTPSSCDCSSQNRCWVCCRSGPPPPPCWMFTSVWWTCTYTHTRRKVALVFVLPKSTSLVWTHPAVRTQDVFILLHNLSHTYKEYQYIDGFQMSIKRPISGGQMRNQEAAIQWTLHLERSSFFYLSVRTWCSTY